jgi:hypothetical protein
MRFFYRLSRGVADIPNEILIWRLFPSCLHKRFPAGGADDFLRNFETSSLQTHSSKRVLAAHTLLHLFFGCHLQEVP